MKSADITKFFGFLAMSLILFVPVMSHADDPLALPSLLPVSDTDKQPTLEESDVSRFTNSIALINEFYVKPIEEKVLLENAIKGIVAGLDSHSEYLDAAAYKTSLLESSGEFSAIGIEVTSEYDVLKVISPIDDTPAAKAGILSGDYIVAINSKLVSNMTKDEAVEQIHGKKDGTINLTILRKGEDKPLSFTLKHGTVHAASVKSKMLDNGFGYLRISQFQKSTPELMISAIKTLQADPNGKLKGLVLDLRNNPGGLVESAVKVVNAFLDSANLHNYKKEIVYTEGNIPNLQYEAKANSTDILNGMPIIVLMNQGTASAAEIVAGALQDYHRATIVGLNSFGKASVQSIIPLDNTRALKLTTALYYTPAGRQIQKEGLRPDVLVENLKVITTNADFSAMGSIREYELKNRLVGRNADSKKSVMSEDFTDLAQQDFQLYQALKMLQVVSAAGNKTLVKN